MHAALRRLSDADLLSLIAGVGPSVAEPRPVAPARPASPAFREALRRMRKPEPTANRPTIRCSAEAFRLLGRRFARGRQERFYVVALDVRNRPLSRHLVAVGTLASCMVHPREVFAPLVRRRAAAAILAHNHPSGDATPSPEDLQLTERLAACGRLLGIPVLDHLIAGADGYYSFRDSGRMEPPAGGCGTDGGRD